MYYKKEKKNETKQNKSARNGVREGDGFNKTNIAGQKRKKNSTNYRFILILFFIVYFSAN